MKLLARVVKLGLAAFLCFLAAVVTGPPLATGFILLAGALFLSIIWVLIESASKD